MKNLIAAITTLVGLSISGVAANSYPLDYDQMVILDAEDMAETGIKEAYEKVKPLLKTYIAKPDELTEKFDSDLPSYSVSCSGITYEIYSPSLPETGNQSWGRATHALFTIVNNQLKGATVKFYAINGGNELGGMFLTEAQVTAARKGLERKPDWPYIPTLEHPWYGQYHDE